MQRVHLRTALLVLVLLTAPALHAQAPASSSALPAVPRVVRLTGTFVPANGLPSSPIETVTLAIYSDENGGAPLWQETQYVTLDAAGRYAVLLGATQPEGLPVDLFASGEARWLGRRFERAGEPEQARVLLTSVPYALKAANADTLGGLPPSAYQLVDQTASGGTASALAPTTTTAGASVTREAAAPAPQSLTSGTAGCLAEFTNSTDLGCSPMVDTGGAIGLGTATPFDRFHVRFTNTTGAFTGLAVQNLGNTVSSYSGMLFYDQNGALGQFQGFNNSTHEYRINNIASGGSINFMLAGASKFQVRADGDVNIAGSLRKGGVRFLHTFGTDNTFLGVNAGNVTMSGGWNTAVGNSALGVNSAGFTNAAFGAYAMQSNTTGAENTAAGGFALQNNTTGNENTATGELALAGNATGSQNTANGRQALASNTSGSDNTASGVYALLGNTIGSNNVGVGYDAGLNGTTGSNNIYLGANVAGVAGESNTMYLGLQGTQTRTFIAGIRGITTGLADAISVMIDSNGQLGTISSSRRFKEDIHDMGDASRALFALRPVTFRYSQAYTNGAKPIQYGLVAEEVAEAFPDLAVRNADGGVDTVHYETLSVLLLNEVQRQQDEIRQQRIEMQRRSDIQTQTIEKQQERIEALERRLNALLPVTAP